MTNDRIYAEIVAMLREYEAQTGRADGSLDKLLSDTRRLEELAIFQGCPNIYASAARIILHLREKMDKKTTGAGRVNVCKRLINSIDRQGKPDMGGIREMNDRFCILDGYRAFRFSADVPSIRRAKYPFDYEKLFSGFSVCGEKIPLVSKAEIKSFIAMTGQTRAKPGEPFFLLSWYAVNPFYLLDVLDAIPDAVFYVPESYCKPLYFADDAGNDGILLPVRTEKAVQAWHERKAASVA